MRPFFIKDILNIVQGELFKGPSNKYVSYATYKRQLMKNYTLFFDLSKTNHKYPDTFNKYKYPIIVTEQPEKYTDSFYETICIVKVKNIQEAYWNFVDHYRKLLTIPIIGLTGTCGKTTVKEMIKHILSEEFEVQATYKSHNASKLNLHYLVSIEPGTQVGVYEMGVFWPEDLAESCRYFKPQIRVLLNIGVYHLTGCKTPEAYQRAKADILEGLDPEKDTLILNKDDNNIQKIDVSKYKDILITFGKHKDCDFQAIDITYGESGMLFTMLHKAEPYQVYVPGYGEHNVYNALAAFAAVTRVGMDLQTAIQSLATYEPVIEHLEVRSGSGGATIIDDTWNTSPLSTSSALKVLKNLAVNKKKIALLGYMPQLGDSPYALQQYAEIGKEVIKNDIDLLIVVGDEATEIGTTAKSLGMNETSVFFCSNGNEIYHIIQDHLNDNTVILLKITHRQMVEPSFVKLKDKIISP